MTDATTNRRTNSPTTLTVREPAAGTAVLTVTGEVDILTSPDLGRAVTEQLDTGVQRLVLDLTGIRFRGTSGLATLVRVEG